MYFSKTVEYALRAVVHLAQNPGEPRKTSVIAESTQVPAAYLSKVLQSLRAGDVVEMQRGIGGGVTLARDPEELTILDVINALCALHKRMDKVIEAIETAFQSTTLSELLSDPNPSVPLQESKSKKRSKK